MKICITSLGSDLNSPIDPRFGRAQYFLLLDEKGELKEVSSNPGILARGGAGITAAQKIVNQGVEILITGNVGPNAFQALSAGGIKVMINTSGTVMEAIERYKRNELKEILSPSVHGHYGMGRGRGMGGKRGRRSR